MIELLKTRNQRLKEKAVAGSAIHQLKYAWNCYKGKRMERSIPAAQYWAFKAYSQGLKKASELCEICTYPYFTGKEHYLPYKPWDVSLTSGGWWYSDRFRLKFDKYAKEPGWYRTYYVYRFVILFFPKGAFRVYESNGGYRIIARERWRFFEYIWWYLIDIFVVAGILFLVISSNG